MRTTGNAGYSLVEMSLALLVGAVGVVTIFGLFPDGLGASRRAVDATEMSTFAEYVFASLESDSEFEDWALFGSTAPVHELMPLYGLKWHDTQPVRVANPNNANPQPRVFHYRPDWYGSDDDGNIAEWGADVTGEFVKNYEIITLTYELRITTKPQTNGKVKCARLEVWNGDRTDGAGAFPGAKPLDSTVFYREFRPPR